MLKTTETKIIEYLQNSYKIKMTYKEIWEKIEKQIKGVNDLKQILLQMQEIAEMNQNEKLLTIVKKGINTIDSTLVDINNIKKSNMSETQKFDMILKKLGENIYGAKK